VESRWWPVALHRVVERHFSMWRSEYSDDSIDATINPGAVSKFPSSTENVTFLLLKKILGIWN